MLDIDVVQSRFHNKICFAIRGVDPVMKLELHHSLKTSYDFCNHIQVGWPVSDIYIYTHSMDSQRKGLA